MDKNSSCIYFSGGVADVSPDIDKAKFVSARGDTKDTVLRVTMALAANVEADHIVGVAVSGPAKNLNGRDQYTVMTASKQQVLGTIEKRGDNHIPLQYFDKETGQLMPFSEAEQRLMKPQLWARIKNAILGGLGIVRDAPASHEERLAQIGRRALENRYGSNPRLEINHESFEFTTVTYAYAPGEACSGDARSEWISIIGIQDDPMSVEFAERNGAKVLVARFRCWRP